MGNAGWVPNLLMYPPDLEDEVVGWREEACLGLGGQVNVSYQSKSDRKVLLIGKSRHRKTKPHG
jgi:hypothetical protein